DAWRDEIALAEDPAAAMECIGREGSLLPNRATGGAIDFTPPPGPQSSDPAVIDALFALERPGEVSDVIASGDFHWLVMFLEERPSTKRPFAEVSETLRTKLLEEQRQNRRRALLDELRADTSIEIFPEALAKARAPK
ncbi:MAG: peptidylprolyl isomerase, partial [Myxococcota bacterium]